MPDLERLRELLDRRDFTSLLVGELGWDNPPDGAPDVTSEDDGLTARLVAIKRGVGVWVIDGLPPGPVQRRLDAQVAKLTRERLLVFAVADRQVWQWPELRPSGAGYRLVAHEHFVGKENAALLQRLAAAAFTIGEESTLTVMDVLHRVRRSFHAEKVTKRFYRQFKAHKEELLEHIEGIEAPEAVAWYGSVLLNRLMLVYFLQKKGFLDGDYDYLAHRLQRVREHLGENAFYGFFRDFMLPFFHDGLGSYLQDYDDPAIARIVGDVPYINGGIFLEHPLESDHEIDVPDTAFEAIFAFFDQFRWHLDERPTDDPNEINPDVLGYVFEQYVNSKEMGAYYTKEDVTGYMTTATLLPAYLDRLDLAAGEPWALLEADPDRYIHDSVRHGTDLPLPMEVEAGLEDGEQRDDWWEKATPDLGLPGENWWEVVDRRRRYAELRGTLLIGGIGDVAACVTENLDLRTLVIDHLDQLPDVAAVEQAFGRLSALTVLDPTCGSGAFLFAALEIFADLYLTLIERAQELVDAGERPPAFLEEAARHPNLNYFVLRSAQLNNLYGVDIMEEAGEIARLRLFLKLAAQLEHRDQIEPFPDLDLNLKCGNLLVGIADQGDVEHRFGTSIIASAVFDRTADSVDEAATVYEDFVAAQSRSDDPETIRDLKDMLRERTREVRTEVDRLLHEIRTEQASLDEWVASEQPFHWFLEFPKVFQQGGFDVVVGNPPYIKASSITEYRYMGFETRRCTDIYAACMERSLNLTKEGGTFGMIVPHSASFSSRFPSLRRVCEEACEDLWVSSYGRIPAGLFSAETRVRNSIVIARRTGSGAPCILHTTRLRRWNEDYRPSLMNATAYATPPKELWSDQWPFVGSNRFAAILGRRMSTERAIGTSTIRSRRLETPPRGARGALSPTGPFAVLFKTSAYNWLPVFVEPPPAFDASGAEVEQTKMRALWFRELVHRDAAWLALAGKWGFAWWCTYGDDFDVTVGLLEQFPADVDEIGARLSGGVGSISIELAEELEDHVVFKLNAGKRMGNYNLRAVREITDRADQALCTLWGEDAMDELNLLYHQTIRTEGGDA